MFESIVRFKRPENENRILKWKLQSVIEWKCSKNINVRARGKESSDIAGKTEFVNVKKV
jgi:hypothetical protein